MSLTELKEGTVQCKTCKGSKILETDRFFLLKLCETCGGNGYLDWIENATNIIRREKNSGLEDTIAIRNTELLCSIIKRVLKDVGIDAAVTIESMTTDSHLEVQKDLLMRF